MNTLKKLGNYIWNRKFLKQFLIIVAIYIVGFLIFRFCVSNSTNFGQKIEVPNLLGKNQNNLKNLLAESELEYEVLDSIYDPSKVEGTILNQDPEPTSISKVYVKEGRKIKIRVSKRTQLVEMPNLVDKSQRFAESVLRNRKFRYELVYRASPEAHGAVIEQLYQGKKIDAGRKIPIGSKIKLIVGRDEAGVPQDLPDLTGLTIEEAKRRVEGMLNMSFSVSCDPGYSRADSLNSRVISQSPEYVEGARVASGSTISVFVTKDGLEQ